MKGPTHYSEAERLIEQARDVQADSGPGCGSAELLAEAQVHATLAQTAATVEAMVARHTEMYYPDLGRRWMEAIT